MPIYHRVRARPQVFHSRTRCTFTCYQCLYVYIRILLLLLLSSKRRNSTKNEHPSIWGNILLAYTFTFCTCMHVNIEGGVYGRRLRVASCVYCTM